MSAIMEALKIGVNGYTIEDLVKIYNSPKNSEEFCREHNITRQEFAGRIIKAATNFQMFLNELKGL